MFRYNLCRWESHDNVLSIATADGQVQMSDEYAVAAPQEVAIKVATRVRSPIC